MQDNKTQNITPNDEQINLYTLIIFSENIAGALNQVTNVFTRRQLNIESLNVSPSGTDGVHRYTLTCKTTEKTVSTMCKQLEKKIDIIQAQYFTTDEVFLMEQALYKVDTVAFSNNKELSRAVRHHDARIVEVNPTYCVIAQESSHKEIATLYYRLKESKCLLQAVSSGVIAVTRSRREHLAELLEKRQHHD